MSDSPDAKAGAAPVYSPSPAFARVHVIVNPASGAEEPVLKPLNTAFTKYELGWEITVTKGPGDAARAAGEAAASGVDVVAVYGGDGTVLEVAGALVGQDMPLLILPGGTANVISIELGVPRALAEALALLAPGASHLRAVDMGRAGDHYFFHLGMGLEGEMIKAATREEKDKSGLLAYVMSGLRSAANLQQVRYHLTLDGEPVEAVGVNLMITNFGSLGIAGLSLSKKIDMSDGLMDVLVIHKVDVRSVIGAAASALTQGDVAQPLTQWQVREVTVVTDTEQSMTRDGEVFEGQEIHARVVPRAVRVVVPLAQEA